MKKFIKTETLYQCEKCQANYSSQSEAEKCETKSITHDKGVKVGDIVLITAGQGAGQRAEVETVYVIDKAWGHREWETYWHTVALTAKLDEGWGNRLLTFDSYTTIDIKK